MGIFVIVKFKIKSWPLASGWLATLSHLCTASRATLTRTNFLLAILEQVLRHRSDDTTLECAKRPKLWLGVCYHTHWLQFRFDTICRLKSSMNTFGSNPDELRVCFIMMRVGQRVFVRRRIVNNDNVDHLPFHTQLEHGGPKVKKWMRHEA